MSSTQALPAFGQGLAAAALARNVKPAGEAPP
jgi:hypothetical protein